MEEEVSEHVLRNTVLGRDGETKKRKDCYRAEAKGDE